MSVCGVSSVYTDLTTNYNFKINFKKWVLVVKIADLTVYKWRYMGNRKYF